MDTPTPSIPKALQEIIRDFQLSEGREKLELLLDYAGQMPELPEWLKNDHDRMQFVPECMTPVYVYAETQDNRMTFYFDVPAESPTVRGYAAFMAAGLQGATPQEVLGLPNDFFLQMGLESVLTHQRLNGIAAILAHMKRLAFEAVQ